MRFIDRLVSCVGARRLVDRYPGIGYLLTEVIPVIIWGFFCGAMSYDNYYLIRFLQLLGASDTQIAILPILYFSAFSLQYIFMHRGSQENSANAKAIAVRTSFIGRSLWLGIPIWAVTCHYCQWSSDVAIYVILGIYFLAHIQLFFSLNYFVTWTQALVQQNDRSAVFAFRYFGMYITLGIIAYVVSSFWPEQDETEKQFWYFIGIFGSSTLICLASTWMLAAAPDMPVVHETQRNAPKQPIRSILQERPRLRALICFSACNGAALCCFITWLPNYLSDQGIFEKTVSFWQSCAYFPCVLIGFALSVRLIPLISSIWTLIISLGIWPLSICLFLNINHHNALWLLPLAFALFGLSKALLQIGGFTSLHDLSPQNDVRVPALNFCALGLGGLSASIIIIFGKHHIEQMLTDSTWSFPALMFCCTIVLNLLGAGLLLRSLWQVHQERSVRTP